MKKDKFGYTTEGWHPVIAEVNNAWTAFHQAGPSDSTDQRICIADEAGRKLRRRLEDRLRKDSTFLNMVALLAESNNTTLFTEI